MNIWPLDNDHDLDAYYGGRPDGSAAWESKNLVYVPIPWKAYLAGTKIELKKGLRVHYKIAKDTQAILEKLWVICDHDQEEIAKYHLDQIGGAYHYRQRRGSSRISNHARGIAIDIDPAHNAMHRGNRGTIPLWIVSIFEEHGWRWGGEYGDPMHFEACR
jgi:hypothetical protein